MKLTWLGHACFLLEEDGYRIVLDPYTGVAGYPPLHIQAHAVFCSHGHFDHHATDCVELLPERESPFTVREENVPLVDVRGAFLDYGHLEQTLCADGTHPNTVGQGLITKAFQDFGRGLRLAGQTV